MLWLYHAHALWGSAPRVVNRHGASLHCVAASRMLPFTRASMVSPVCGPSGAGKSTLVSMLMQEYEHEFGFSVSHTTRAPRKGEIDGVRHARALRVARVGAACWCAPAAGDPVGHCVAIARVVPPPVSYPPFSPHSVPPLPFAITRVRRRTHGLQVHYNFTDLEAIKQEIAAGMFVESNLVHGNMYGTSRAALQSVEAATQICLLDIDIQVCGQANRGSWAACTLACLLTCMAMYSRLDQPQGVHSCQQAELDATYILILPPSLEELERRLRTRGTDSEAAIVKRMLDARVELDVASRTKFDGRIKNEDKDSAYLQLRELLRPQVELCQDLRRRRGLPVSSPKK